ncbi:conserved hypothetical protein [Chromobacterium violaceum ATCC 12472]|uniref:CRM domain-containing protein n=2 Tax=Chromobacterium violaceum TaxID=536 RepID=Q7NRI2_CHRVO|nr:conserved hypothetical protein [Chromobacterium violaceum ATCC 12472]
MPYAAVLSVVSLVRIADARRTARYPVVFRLFQPQTLGAGPNSSRIAFCFEFRISMKIELKPFQRKYLQGLAHGIDPVVMVGNNGLTEAVVREIAISLDAHELIKVRVLGDDRDARIAMFEQICDELGCAPVQHIGKLLVLWRPSDKARIALPKNKQAMKD